eukprot:3604820-Alexandrium_andersonii.AAC.1
MRTPSLLVVQAGARSCDVRSPAHSACSTPLRIVHRSPCLRTGMSIGRARACNHCVHHLPQCPSPGHGAHP